MRLKRISFGEEKGRRAWRSECNAQAFLIASRDEKKQWEREENGRRRRRRKEERQILYFYLFKIPAQPCSASLRRPLISLGLHGQDVAEINELYNSSCVVGRATAAAGRHPQEDQQQQHRPCCGEAVESVELLVLWEPSRDASVVALRRTRHGDQAMCSLCPRLSRRKPLKAVRFDSFVDTISYCDDLAAAAAAAAAAANSTAASVCTGAPALKGSRRGIPLDSVLLAKKLEYFEIHSEIRNAPTTNSWPDFSLER
ncbi:hypothetical protein HPB50_004715 [Hyalomma asiaticum]|uniref:Uncharacterized protein n=1 Tax=Hyalomma asiaticum TaxID=266040 RepID=A0ACB7STE6_HYAAI|nr:hypothetical protein HPB50_004715 [Hyalomma asiaticum]